MGGGIYSQDVARSARSSGNAFAYNAYQATEQTARRVHPALSPYRTVREVNNETPIVVALDVTRSRGDDTKLMYEKLPMLMGQIELKGYVKGPGISFAAIGDAHSDQAPLQVGQFEADNRLDEMLSRIWIEEGGGGTGQESYELAALYYSRTDCVRLRNGSGRKGYFFFVGDEGFYPKIEKEQAARILGQQLPADLPSAEAFRRLQEKFEVFLLYPKKTFEDRRKDIDAEIRQRVTAAGGQYDNVDVRASLIWNNRNDLDLHVVAPSGEEIYFGNKKGQCGGWLDVDMNVSGDSLKPVENVRWARGQAPAGRYTVFVQNYRFHEQKHDPTPFKVEIEVNGEVRHFEAVASPKGQTGSNSNVKIWQFDYDPDKRAPKKEKPKKGGDADKYAAYSDEVILAQWGSVIPKERILRIDDPKSIIDVLLGALAISEGTADLENFLRDMKAREQSEARIAQVRTALEGLTRPKAPAAEVEGQLPAAASGATPRAGRSRRL